MDNLLFGAVFIIVVFVAVSVWVLTMKLVDKFG
jgi:hypothetical protein